MRVFQTLERNVEQEQKDEITFDQRRYRAVESGQVVSVLTLNVFGPESVIVESRGRVVIDTVETAAESRRHGFASKLYAMALKRYPALEHSEWQTPEGLAWAARIATIGTGDGPTAPREMRL